MRAQGKGTSAKEGTPGRRPAARPTRAPGWAAGVLDLQRLAGNAAVSRAVETERHQHSAGCGHEQQPAVQRSSLVHQVLNSPGSSLNGALAGEMSARFGGVDFSSVRVHTDTVAQRSAAEIGATAYTSRDHVVWDGRDKHTLAHELTHVVQQRQGPVSGADNGGGLRVSDPGDSYERAAEANARRVMAGPAPVQRAVEQHTGHAEHTGHAGHDHAGHADHASSATAPAGDVGAFVQRRAETPARIGFEFQQLRSEVEVKGGTESSSDDGLFASDETKSQSSESEPDVYDAEAKHYGRGQDQWYVVKDGKNLEFVTQPFASMEKLVEVMGEISRVAKFLEAATKHEQKADSDAAPEFEIGDKYVTVFVPDSAGQPQVNPDVPLDSLPALYEHAGGDDQHFQDFYGADRGTFWKAEDTKQEMEDNAKVAAKVLSVDAGVLARTFGMEDTSPEKLGSVRGLLQVLTAAAVHQAWYPTALPKDQPVLLKTHMGRLWQELETSDVIGSEVAAKAVVQLMCQVSEDLIEKRGVCDGIVNKVMQGVDPVWAGPLDSVDIGAPAQQGGPATEDRKQILVELRRVPVLAIDEWPAFAAKSFAHFIQDSADRYHQDL
ncbi:DUF4157 domain-containing protein [Streptomyces sp. NPDC050263]|uniref:eCIS core domain-containing protein n=1 Tax=Streptomyces sp. NPDC050263 TaxID=3155037 RepID=UPI00343AF1F4